MVYTEKKTIKRGDLGNLGGNPISGNLHIFVIGMIIPTATKKKLFNGWGLPKLAKLVDYHNKPIVHDNVNPGLINPG